MKKIKLCSKAVITGLTLALVACGGGGSSSSNKNSGSIEYIGETASGKLTEENFREVTRAAVKVSAVYELPYYLNNLAEDVLDRTNCNNNGDADVSITGNDNDFVTTSHFTNCSVTQSGGSTILNGGLEYGYNEKGSVITEKLKFKNISVKDAYSKTMLNGSFTEINTPATRDESWEFSWTRTESVQNASLKAKGSADYRYASGDGVYQSILSIDGESYKVVGTVAEYGGYLYLENIKFYHPKYGYFILDDSNEGDECLDYVFDRESGILYVEDATGSYLTVSFRGCGQGHELI